jgi:hypothetical protein
MIELLLDKWDGTRAVFSTTQRAVFKAKQMPAQPKGGVLF